MTPSQAALILKYLRVLTFGLTHAPELIGDLQRLNAELDLMIAERRDPTQAEYDALDARLDQAHHALSVL